MKFYSFTRMIISFYLIVLTVITLEATEYHIGPNHPLSTISEAPWNSLQAGDIVYIHWRSTPYKEKWVINAQGTANNPIHIIGVSGSQGQKPVIDGNGAVTVAGVNFWNEERGVIKIGGSNTPADGLPSHIIIENLEIKSGRPAYQFTNDNNQTSTYSKNAAAIYVEKAEHLVIRDCILRDSGNGLFIGANDGQTKDILIASNYIYDNGIENSIFEHNAYTAGIGMTFQYNRFGPLRNGALGNNLKDRSAGLTVRYNWIESGNRQLDLVDAEDSQVLVNHPSYSTTYVYGNILIEPDGAGNSQIVHYGGDSGTTTDYRKGTLYFYNNTIVSTRSGNTTLMRLSTNDETALVFNNIVYPSASGTRMAMIDGSGTFTLSNNWLKTGWQSCHCTPSGTVNDQGNNIEGSDPLFQDFNTQDFAPQENSVLIDQSMDISPIVSQQHYVISQYEKHLGTFERSGTNNDIGALENATNLSIDDIRFQKTIAIFPNPAHESISINLKNEIISSISIYNEIGQRLMEHHTNSIRISELQVGIYLMKIVTKSGKRSIKKIVKK